MLMVKKFNTPKKYEVFAMCNQRRFFTQAAVMTLLVLFIGVGSAYSGDFKGKLEVPAPGNTQILQLNDGSSLRGEVTEVGDTAIKFKTDMGEMEIEISKIKEIQEVSSSSFKGGKYWFPNPNRNRLYFSPTGRMLKRGSGYFSDWYLFFPSITYGVIDNFSMGVGVSIFPGLGFDKQLLFFMPKIGITAVKNVDFAVSALIIRIPDWDEEDVFTEDSRTFYVGTIYGVGTIGSDDHSLTVGLGWGYADKQIADKPFVILGGETRAFRRMSFLFESWLMPGVDQPLFMYGTRFFGEGLAVDLGLVTPLGKDFFFPGVPFLGFNYNF